MSRQNAMSLQTVDPLNRLLADYQVHYQRLRAYHWNVRGPMFYALHAEFEAQYLATAEKVDAIAERVSALGGMPLSTFAEVLSQARLSEDDATGDANEMVGRLLEDLATLDSNLRDGCKVASEHDDSATLNLLEGYADEQEKTAWMLRAFQG